MQGVRDEPREQPLLRRADDDEGVVRGLPSDGSLDVAAVVDDTLGVREPVLRGPGGEEPSPSVRFSGPLTT